MPSVFFIKHEQNNIAEFKKSNALEYWEKRETVRYASIFSELSLACVCLRNYSK